MEGISNFLNILTEKSVRILSNKVFFIPTEYFVGIPPISLASRFIFRCLFHKTEGEEERERERTMHH